MGNICRVAKRASKLRNRKIDRMVKIAKALLGPNELSEFLSGDQLAWTLYQGGKYFEGLLLQSNPSPVFPQFACLQIQLEPLKPDEVVHLFEVIHPDTSRTT
jgi:hypothetical protein